MDDERTTNADMEAKFSPIGRLADAWLRAPASPLEIPLQIVCAFDGVEFAAQMKELNARGRTRTVVQSASEFEQKQARLVVSRIAKKSAMQYPSNFWLLVAVDDLVIRLGNLSGLIAQASEAASRSTFDQVHMVGLVGHDARRIR